MASTQFKRWIGVDPILPPVPTDMIEPNQDVGSFSEGNNYSGYLPAGQHRLTVRAEPTRGGVGPGRKTINVQAGQTYSFTAAWSGGNLRLVRNP